MQFDLVITNPPFQDSVNRKKTPHKLWIDFTLSVFSRLVRDGGSLVQVSPASFASPSNLVLNLMEEHQTHIMRWGTGHHFPEIGSTFSDYWIEKSPNDGRPTRVVAGGERFDIELDSRVFYLPNDISRLALSIHEKVMYADRPRLRVEWDYVTAHNIRRYRENPTLVEVEDAEHPFPVFHTNRSTWWSSIRQDWADSLKVMWTRSGYTKPFFDPGLLGGTDMVYFVRVASIDEGELLAHNMNSSLMRYIYKSAKWSGFGNERVFSMLPELPRDRLLSDADVYAHFDLVQEEVDYVEEHLAPGRRKSK
ncbi:MAG: hypothetical protein B7Y93_00090 [Micrococcales bacterium 32-70-13]|nr:MAG: hypothetical protein B7Y93_00090 [Micrococcales bacterium 32-70-13]